MNTYASNRIAVDLALENMGWLNVGSTRQADRYKVIGAELSVRWNGDNLQSLRVTRDSPTLGEALLIAQAAIQ